MVPLVVGEHGGKLGDVPISRTYDTARSVEFDAVVVADTPDRYEVDVMRAEVFHQCKAIVLLESLENVRVDTSAPGVVTVSSLSGAVDQLIPLMRGHRVWERQG